MVSLTKAETAENPRSGYRGYQAPDGGKSGDTPPKTPTPNTPPNTPNALDTVANPKRELQAYPCKGFDEVE